MTCPRLRDLLPELNSVTSKIGQVILDMSLCDLPSPERNYAASKIGQVIAPMFPSNAGQMITSAVASPHNQRERERKKERDTNMSLTNLII